MPIDEIAAEIYPVVRRTLELYGKLKDNEPLSLDAVQADLRGRVRASPNSRNSDILAPMGYLGPQAPLVYWIDEIFSLYSPWSQDWENRVFEQAIYGTHDRAHLFWDQAREAVRRADRDALEVFYLALLLGFRGVHRDQPRDLQDWREQFESQVGVHEMLTWPEAPPALPVPPTNVPELTAKANLRLFLFFLAVVGMGLIGIVTFLLGLYGAS